MSRAKAKEQRCDPIVCAGCGYPATVSRGGGILVIRGRGGDPPRLDLTPAPLRLSCRAARDWARS